MKFIGIIPARYASTRFPAKALADVKGKSMIRRVYEKASKAKSLQELVVATDHEEIHRHVTDFGGKVLMTSPDHQSGTDRCYEAFERSGGSFDFVLNIQGDEPMIVPEQIDILTSAVNSETEIATLVKRVETLDELHNPGEAKVILDKNGKALYFSRAIIPFAQKLSKDQWLSQYPYFKHIGIYAYRADVLKAITLLEQSTLEKAESLEQLRWLENGYRIQTAETHYESYCIDTPQDLENILDKIPDEN